MPGRGDTQGRIIPARAGQTGASSFRRGKESDHPRACGANTRMVAQSVAVPGSSPRVRGKPRHRQRFVGLPRIIPARAGQTRATVLCAVYRPDHPRACGANAAFVSYSRPASGSSPRVRGKLQQSAGQDRRIRIIPARAGQTHGRSAAPSRRTDHPRACGANGVPLMALLDENGSSPRVRGKPPEYRA